VIKDDVTRARADRPHEHTHRATLSLRRASVAPIFQEGQMSKTTDITTLSTKDLASVLEKADALVEEIWGLLPGLATLDREARVHSTGRLRDGEAHALGAVIDVVAQNPSLFTFLADHDFGTDPKKVETSLLRDRLAHVERLRAFADDVRALADALTDTALVLGEKVRPPLLAAYKVAQVAAQHDEKMRGTLAPATDFFGKIGRAGLATRRRKASAAGTPK
jgi:hypothetical protein